MSRKTTEQHADGADRGQMADDTIMLYVGATIILVAAVYVIGGAIAGPGPVEDGERYNVTFKMEGDCPDGTLLQVSPVEQRNETIRIWRNEAVDWARFEVIGNRTYDLRLVRPGMDNSTMQWTATSREVVFKNSGSGECEFKND